MWTPSLPETAEPIYQRLIAALDADIESGVLSAGTRLPPQRDLAYRLGLGVGTVTRAYSEAERLGMIHGQVGRGSFVADRGAGLGKAASGVIDLARNLPPLEPAERQLAAALAKLSRRRDLAECLTYPPVGGYEGHRRAGAQWLQQTSNYGPLDWRRVILCAGAQQGVAISLAALCRPGDAVIAEVATFAGLKTLAARGMYRLVAADMDREGLTPDALDRAAAQSGAKVAYLLPVQNPTGRVMSLQRRQDILAVARRRDLMIVEDDLYGAYAQTLGLPPLAALAPDRVCYVSGLSKSLAPGLRVGYVAAPSDGVAERVLEALRAVAFGGPTFGALIASQWIDDGAAFDIFAEVLRETQARTDIARRVLGAALEPAAVPALPHLWLPLSELAAEQVAGRAMRGGVQVTPPRAMVLDDAPVTGLRLCLGPAHDRAALERGLAVVAAALSPDGGESRYAV